MQSNAKGSEGTKITSIVQVARPVTLATMYSCAWDLVNALILLAAHLDNTLGGKHFTQSPSLASDIAINR
jgi:hypothetical protein